MSNLFIPFSLVCVTRCLCYTSSSVRWFTTCSHEGYPHDNSAWRILFDHLYHPSPCNDRWVRFLVQLVFIIPFSYYCIFLKTSWNCYFCSETWPSCYATYEHYPQKSLEIPIIYQKSRTPNPEIPLKNKKSRTPNPEIPLKNSRTLKCRSDLPLFWFIPFS